MVFGLRQVAESGIGRIVMFYKLKDKNPNLKNIAQVRKTPRWPRSWANFSLFTAVFSQECMGQLASFGPT